MGLSSLSVKRPVTTTMLVLVVLIFGFISFLRIPIDLFPDIEVPVAIVSTSYPNVSPEEIEKLVTRPLEEAVGTVENLDTISSMSMEGNSIVIIQFKYGTDMDYASLKMREKVDMIKGFLPDGTSSPIVMQIDPNAQAIIQIALSGGEISDMENYADSTMKPALEKIEGVASVTIAGGYEKYVSIQIDSEKLNGYGMTLDSVAQMLAAENINLPAGSVIKGTHELLLKSKGEFEDLQDIRDIVLVLPTGGTLHLSDIAEIVFASKDVESISKLDGEPVVSLSIQKQSGTNTVQVANEIAKVVSGYGEIGTYDLKIVSDQSEYIKSAISNLTSSGIMGGILAVLVLFIFLRNVRSTIIIALSIPFSIISTFVLIYFNGITINLMTLSGLTLGIGSLVDCSIVVLENIYRYAQEGHSKREAAIEGAKEVAMPVVASVLTTVAVFIPIVFVEGIAGMIFKDLALTFIFSQLASLVISLTLIPMMASKMLKVDENQGKHHTNKFKPFAFILDQTDKGYAKLEHAYKRLLRWAINHGKRVIAFTLILFILSVSTVAFIGMEFIPATDEGLFSVTLELEPGSQIEKVGEAIDMAVTRMEDIPELDYLYTSTAGSTFVSTSQTTGTISGVLLPLEERERSVNDIVVEVEQRLTDIPGVKVTTSVQSSMAMMSGSAISVEIRGDSLEVLKDLAADVVHVARSLEGTRNVSSSISESIPQIEMVINREVAAQYGLTTYQISTAVKNILDGQTATTYKLNGNEIDVIIEGDASYSESIENLKQLSIKSPMGTRIPLELIADFSQQPSPAMIMRDSQSRIVTVTSDVYGSDLSTVTVELQKALDKLPVPNGYTVELTGQNEEMINSFRDLGLALVLAVILVYMIIASQFESLLSPFIIMFTSPISIGAGLLGLFITNRTLNIESIIGFIMLEGIVVNNAIVLIEYINQRRERGESREDAILNAGPIRLRPILMTTLTTVLGLLPMAMGIGSGAELQAPMATVILFGLTISTLLTLVFIPVLYTKFDDVHQRFIDRRHKSKAAALPTNN